MITKNMKIKQQSNRSYTSGVKVRISYFLFYHFKWIYHVLLLVINNQNPCDRTIKIYDQIKDRGDYIPFSRIDKTLLDMNINNWNNAASLTKDNTASTKFGIWKIQRR